MPKPPKLIAHFSRALLLTVVFTPYLSFASQTELQPCTQFLKTITANEDQPYVDLYGQSMVTPEKAELRLPQLTKKLDPKASPARQAVYLLTQYNIEHAEGDNELKAMDYITELKRLGERAESEWMVAEALLYEAAALVDKRNYDLAESKLSVVENSARGLDHHSLLARALKWQGNIDIDRSEYKRGLQRYQEAYDIFVDCGDKLQLARVLSNMSRVYIRMEEWSKADYYLSQALDIYSDHAFSNPLTEAILHINASVIDKYLDRPEKRADHIRLAMKLAAKTSSYRVKLTALMNLTAVQLDHNKPQAALRSSKDCLDLAQSQSDPNGIANCNESLAESYMQLGIYDKALHHAFLALEAYEQQGDRKRSIFTSNIIADIYEASGDYRLALKYYKQSATDDKEYLFDVRRKELFDLQERFEARVKEHEIALLKTENALQTARLAEKKSSENMLQFGIAFILFFLYMLYCRYSNISRNNIALEQSNAELATQSMQDPLTSLYNRRYLENWLAAVPAGSFSAGALVVVLDIDYFKAINDRLGHDAGDQVLTLLAERLRKATRSDDLVIRWGGEEFVLIMKTSQHEVEAVLERLRCEIADVKFSTSAGEIAVTVSLGAVFAHSPESLQKEWKSMLVDADKALYNVKSAGRNGYQLATG